MGHSRSSVVLSRLRVRSVTTLSTKRSLRPFFPVLIFTVRTRYHHIRLRRRLNTASTAGDETDLTHMSAIICVKTRPTERGVQPVSRTEAQCVSWGAGAREHNDWESVKELQGLCGRLDFIHIYAQRKLIFISKLGKLNNDVMNVCYKNFRRSDEGVRLQCEFDIAAGVSAKDIKDIVFSKFYDIAISIK